jgi:hypothetical protein
MMPGTLSIETAIDAGKLVARVRDTTRRCNSDLENTFGDIEAVVREIEGLIEESPPLCVSQSWKMMRTGLSLLAGHGTCRAIAHGAQGDLASEEGRIKVLFRELQDQLRSLEVSLPTSTAAVIGEMLVSADCNISQLVTLLLAIPLPTIYREKEKEPSFRAPADDSGTTASPPPLVRVIASLDTVPVATPQLINPGRIYALRFRVRGIGWPDNTDSLQLMLLSTCPQEEYSLSTFELRRPVLNQRHEFEGELTGQIKFNSAQSTLIEDIVFRLRGAFKLLNGEFRDAPIIGYHELRLKVVNQDRHPLMGGSHRLDRHIEELVIKLLNDCPRVADELADLLPILQALTHLLTTYSQEAIYKGVASLPERDFHETVLHDLRLQLGSDVQNHPNQAGGIGDIRYRGVITELKVEKDTGDRTKIALKYTAQSTQYEGVEARQVSVLLVLDLTSKDVPPGDIRNDVLLVDVPTHGGDDKEKVYPSKAFLFVINGNMKSPSDYS